MCSTDSRSIRSYIVSESECVHISSIWGLTAPSNYMAIDSLPERTPAPSMTTTTGGQHLHLCSML